MPKKEYQDKNKHSKLLPKTLETLLPLSTEDLVKFTELYRMIESHGTEARLLFDVLMRNNFTEVEKYIHDNGVSAEALMLIPALFQSRMRSEAARKSGDIKLAGDPKQKDKVFVRDCWNDWKMKRVTHYKGKTAFAKDMLMKCEALENQSVIVRWCGEWDKENNT